MVSRKTFFVRAYKYIKYLMLSINQVFLASQSNPCTCVFYVTISYIVQIIIFTFYSTYLTQFAKPNKHIFIHSYYTTLLYLTSALKQQQ